MADIKNARSAARAATGEKDKTAPETAATSEKTRTPRQPAPREESDNTTQTQAEAAPAAAQPPKVVPLVVIAPNPKRAGSIAYDFYAMYPQPGVRSTVQDCYKAGVRGKDVSWDADTIRRHILIGDQAEAYLALSESGELEGDELKAAQLEMLKGLKVPEKSLIKWGYMEAPKPAEPTPASPTTEQPAAKQEEPATA